MVKVVLFSWILKILLSLIRGSPTRLMMEMSALSSETWTISDEALELLLKCYFAGNE